MINNLKKYTFEVRSMTQLGANSLDLVRNANVHNVMLLTMSERAWKKDKNFLTSNQIDLA